MKSLVSNSGGAQGTFGVAEWTTECVGTGSGAMLLLGVFISSVHVPNRSLVGSEGAG